MKHAYILFSLFLCHIYIFTADDFTYTSIEKYSHDEGFSAGTKVKIAAGYIPIEEIQQNDKITGYTPDGLADQEVLCISKKLLANHIKIVTDNQTIVAGYQQKFYCPAENRWIEAKDIIANQVLRKKLAEYIVVRQIERHNQPVTTYALTVQGHTFYVTHDNICVHNADTACGYAQVVLQLGLIVCKHPVLELIGQGLNFARGCTIMHSILSARIQEQASATASIQMSPEKIAYETTKQELESIRAEFKQTIDGLKPPKDGQMALDNSIECPKSKHKVNNSKTRIGVSDGEIVLLSQTSPGLYHGHVRKWTELEEHMQRALEYAGLVKNGKIL